MRTGAKELYLTMFSVVAVILGTSYVLSDIGVATSLVFVVRTGIDSLRSYVRLCPVDQGNSVV